MAKPLQFQIVERARALIADEQRWCRGHLAQTASGLSVFPNFCHRSEAMWFRRSDCGGLPNSPTTTMLRTHLPTMPYVHDTVSLHLSASTT